MPLFEARLPDITIPNAGQASNALKAREVFEDAEFVIMYGANVTDTTITYVMQITNNIDAAAPVWFTLQTSPPNPADIAPPLQGKAFPLSRAAAAIMGADAFRVFASAPVTAQRNWNLTKQFRVRD